MLLLIPAIDLRNGVSTHVIEGSGVGNDPAAIARLLRIENAKSLHVTDLDGADAGRFTRFDVMERLFSCVDIPIEVSGGISTEAEARRLLELGACRVVLRPGLIREHPNEASAMVAMHGSGKIVAAIERRAGDPDDEADPVHPLTIGAAAKAMGFRRLLYTELDASGARILNPRMLGRLAGTTGMRVTISGGVTSLAELRTAEALGTAGVDSVILRRAIYENRFSCQSTWRTAEEHGYPYTARV